MHIQVYTYMLECTNKRKCCQDLLVKNYLFILDYFLSYRTELLSMCN